MNDSERFLQLGKYTKEYPEWLVEKAQEIEKTIVDEEYIKKILRIIAEEFDPDKYKIYRSSNIRESRLITARQIIEKRQSTCGSRATVVASVLRKLGIPTKLIHGRYIESNPEMRHAWNEVLLDNGKWVPFDLMGKRWGISEYHIKEFEVVDWEEIEDRIDSI
ncbi:MAG: transglutaminase-like domain-containing protein [Candidatus Dojkabacteria bacterium]